MLVNITDAARLAKKGRATIYRDLNKGRLHKTTSPSGETMIDTSELINTYGKLYQIENEKGNDEKFDATLFSDEASRNRIKVHILEERIKSLERIIELESDLRKVKDLVTDELRARLEDKNTTIQELESKLSMHNNTQDIEKKEISNRQSLWCRLSNKKS
jgi:hypothetical protein